MQVNWQSMFDEVHHRMSFCCDKFEVSDDILVQSESMIVTFQC